MFLSQGSISIARLASGKVKVQMCGFYDKINVSNKSDLLKVWSLLLRFAKLLCRISTNLNELYSKSAFGNQMTGIVRWLSFLPFLLFFFVFLSEDGLICYLYVRDPRGKMVHFFFQKDIALLCIKLHPPKRCVGVLIPGTS